MSERERWDWRKDHGWDRSDVRRRASHRRRGRQRLLAVAVLVSVVAIAAAVAVDRRRGGQAAAPVVTAPPTIKLTFPEGLRREEMAARIEAETDLSGAEYLRLTGPGPLGAQRAQRSKPTSLEGFLFPATYEIGTETTVEFLRDQQLAAYDAKVAAIDMAPAKRRNLTPYDVLIIASMVEREVVVPEERALVAGVIYNRLKNRMLLGIDATVQYAVGDWGEITAADLASDSPYNTRKFAGLPPGPIANPGVPSIEAAARPRVHQFLYYVARNDGTGRHYFARTFDEFERFKAQARANGG